jgi:hypothetical protein
LPLTTLTTLPVRDTLDGGREYEWSYHNDIQRRTDEACSWVTSNASFSYWMLNSRDSNLLALFGNMGCGKTMTTAFVADTLKDRGRPLCAYYCKDEHETTKLGNIYRSILLQFLRRDPRLKIRFWDWYKQASIQVSGNPTQSDIKLRELLFDIISSSKEPVVIVLDALDECKPYPQKQLFSLFQGLFERNAQLKVFISSRYDNDIEAELPSKVIKIDLLSSHVRDRAIAAYLVANVTNLPAPFHPQVVEKLAKDANGSAIWLRIAVEYIAGSRIQNQIGLDRALLRLPSSKGLAELYGKLFHKVCGEFPDNSVLLRQALEILAVSRRPLTLEELAAAVHTINPIQDMPDAETLAELDERAHMVDLFDLVRPFTSASQGEGGKSPRLRLVHQSLRELILQAPPAEWCYANEMAKRKKGERKAELDANLLNCCIKYLLFEECGNKEMFPSREPDTDALFLGVGSAFDDDEDAQSTATQLPSDFSPFERGFGNFFAYAARYWTSHFGEVALGRRPDPKLLMALCQKDSRRLENWVAQWWRPNCRYLPECEFRESISSLDPLVVTAMFGSEASIVDLLQLGLDESNLLQDSV